MRILISIFVISASTTCAGDCQDSIYEVDHSIGGLNISFYNFLTIHFDCTATL